MNIASIAIIGWQAIGFAAVVSAVYVSILWFWFIFLGNGDWSS